MSVSGAAPQPDVDVPGVECLDRSKLLSHDERRMVEHDSTRTRTDRSRAVGDIGDQYSVRGTRDMGPAVMFRQPVRS